MLAYLAHCGDSPGPLFCQEPLTKTKFVDHVHIALLAANIPAHLYTGHSFSVGIQTQPSKPSVDGKAQHTCFMLDSTHLIWQHYHPPWLNAPFNSCILVWYVYLIYVCVNVITTLLMFIVNCNNMYCLHGCISLVMECGCHCWLCMLMWT